MRVAAVAIAALAVVMVRALAPAADMAKLETVNTDGAIITTNSKYRSLLMTADAAG